MIGQRNRMIDRERGWTLVDGLIAIGVFSIGTLGLIAMYGMAIKQSSEAKYRSEASFFADQVIARMWADDKAALAVKYASPDGAEFKVWQAEVQDAGTGLPGTADGNAPTIVVSPGNRVVVTVRWQAPGERAHHYVAEAQVCDDTNC